MEKENEDMNKISLNEIAGVLGLDVVELEKLVEEKPLEAIELVYLTKQSLLEKLEDNIKNLEVSENDKLIWEDFKRFRDFCAGKRLPEEVMRASSGLRNVEQIFVLLNKLANIEGASSDFIYLFFVNRVKDVLLKEKELQEIEKEKELDLNRQRIITKLIEDKIKNAIELQDRLKSFLEQQKNLENAILLVKQAVELQELSKKDGKSVGKPIKKSEKTKEEPELIEESEEEAEEIEGAEEEDGAYVNPLLKKLQKKE